MIPTSFAFVFCAGTLIILQCLCQLILIYGIRSQLCCDGHLSPNPNASRHTELDAVAGDKDINQFVFELSSR